MPACRRSVFVNEARSNEALGELSAPARARMKLPGCSFSRRTSSARSPRALYQFGLFAELRRTAGARFDACTPRGTKAQPIPMFPRDRKRTRRARCNSRFLYRAISSVNEGGLNRVTQTVIRALKSAEFGSNLAQGKDLRDSSLRNASKIKWRRGWDSNPRAGITRPSDFESAPL